MIETVPYHSMASSKTSNFLSQLKYCCCCIPIRTGCFILGYINLIANLLYSIYFISFILNNVGFIDDGIDVETIFAEEEEDDTESRLNNFLNVYGPIVLYSVIRLSWIIICVCCLIGLHKKNPGPIRVFLGFATARIIIQLMIFIHSLLNTAFPTENIIAECIELGLAAYFLITYYIHVLQLERQESEESLPSEVIADDIAFVYPTNMDKDLLVSKEKV